MEISKYKCWSDPRHVDLSFIVCLCMNIRWRSRYQEEERFDPITRFAPATLLCPSQASTRITASYVAIPLFVFNELRRRVIIRFVDDNGEIVDHRYLNFHFISKPTVVKELRSKMFGQHPEYFKAVFLKKTQIIIVSIYEYVCVYNVLNYDAL